jgi:hypothetical protein
MRYTWIMATIGALNIPPALLEAFNKLLCIADNRNKGAVRKIGYLKTREKVLSLTSRSLLPQVKTLRAGLTAGEVIAWKNASLASGQSWYNLFTQDTCYRLKHGVAGLATPSTLHQYMVGRLEISAPADSAILKQYHPNLYYISKKMSSTSTVRQDVAITEVLMLPLSIGVSYRSNLASTGAGSICRFYARIYSRYQGTTVETDVNIVFDNVTDWKRATATSASIIGVVSHYDLCLELVGCRGWIEWDNVVAEHTGTNWARDKRCNDVNNEPTRTNYMIEKSWEEQTLPAGSAFSSVYPSD